MVYILGEESDAQGPSFETLHTQKKMKVGESVGERGGVPANDPLDRLSGPPRGAGSGASTGNAILSGDMTRKVGVLPCPSASSLDRRHTISGPRTAIARLLAR